MDGWMDGWVDGFINKSADGYKIKDGYEDGKN